MRLSHFTRLPSSLVLASTLLAGGASAADWTRFRGENGSGVSTDSAATPVEWSESQNLLWSAELPGPGKSSPIIVGDRVIITCWSGENPPQDLRRHLMCFDRNTGDQMWSKEILPKVTDESFRGMFTENGYASHTPTSDGERIFAFFGKTGVIAFDMEGNEQWQTSVGTGEDPRGWGTASSLVLYKDLVICTAASESQALVALRKDNGEEAWHEEAEGLGATWGTPIVVDGEGGRQDLVLAVSGEVWGINPDTGKLRWYSNGPGGNSMCGSAVTADGVVYVLGERDGGTVAVRGGGKGDVNESHVQWTANHRGRIGTPVVHEGLIYWVSDGVANCIDAATGDRVYQTRLKPPTEASATAEAPAEPPAESPPAQPPVEGFGRPGEFAEFGPPGGGGGRGGGGGMRGQDYSSAVAADGKLYFVRRSGEMYVLALGREFKQLAANKFDSDDGDFSATPAVSDGKLFIRSSNKLYCIGARE